MRTIGNADRGSNERIAVRGSRVKFRIKFRTPAHREPDHLGHMVNVLWPSSQHHPQRDLAPVRPVEIPVRRRTTVAEVIRHAAVRVG